ncbi:MAG: CoA transferase [Deltaproteobacteria bacterium]|nr:MAG: CoA transferase [Deltaproteobacteria bacterium]
MKLKVLDLSRLFPGPYASQVLADLGATVLKVEDPKGGDYLRWMPPLVGGTSALFAALNRGKRSLALDLKREEGREIFLSLIGAGWDVILESFRPGVLDRLGLGYEALAEVAPQVVLCSITGFGSEGPDAGRAGHDLGYLARSGVLHLFGRAGQPPVVPGVQVADLAGGAWPAVAGLLAAVLERTQTGRGRHVEVSMTRGAFGLMVPLLAGALNGGEALAPGAGVLGGGVPAYGVYACADGRTMALAAIEPHFWEAFCVAVGRPDLSGQGLASGEEGRRVRATLEAIFASRTQAEWEAIFREHDCCCEPVREGLEALDDTALALRGRLVEARSPEGEPCPVPLPELSDPAWAPLDVPALGEGTREVLEALGVSGERIESLAADGVVRTLG